MWTYNINQKNQVQSCPKTRSRKFSWLFILEDLLWESRAIIENDTFTQKIASESLINILHKQRKIYLLLEFLVRCSLFFILVFGTDNSFWQLHAFTVPWNKKFFKELIFAPAVGKIHKTTLHNIFFLWQWIGRTLNQVMLYFTNYKGNPTSSEKILFFFEATCSNLWITWILNEVKISVKKSCWTRRPRVWILEQTLLNSSLNKIKIKISLGPCNTCLH